MKEKIFPTGVVSWTTFDALFEQQADFFRKLWFFIKAARALEEEQVAIDSIADFLEQKQHTLQDLREIALQEREQAGGSGVRTLPVPKEEILEREPIGEDLDIFGKFMEIRRMGGDRWDYLKNVIEGTHAAQKEDHDGS